LRRPPAGFTKLRPHRTLFRQALVATSAFLLPIVITLYFLTIPDGPWLVVLIVHALASLIFAIVSASYFMVGIWVDETGIAERGFFGRLDFYRRDEIKRIMLAKTFHGGGTDTLPQLFLCDENDQKLIRLRGQFWSLESMQQLSDILDIPITDLPASEMRDIHDQYPGLLYWFERRPVLAAAVFSAGTVVTGGLVFAILALTGNVPSGA
jgi:hypothetical protein